MPWLLKHHFKYTKYRGVEISNEVFTSYSIRSIYSVLSVVEVSVQFKYRFLLGVEMVYVLVYSPHLAQGKGRAILTVQRYVLPCVNI
jgi:hypothetical protein